jgi:GNAT superfamily N-acetyltransferase
MTVATRLAGPGDLDAVLALLAQLNPEDAPLESALAQATWAAILARPGVDTLVATLDGAVVACLTLIVVPNLSRGARPYAMIENVVTDAAHRGRRIGRTLLDAALRHAWAQDAYKVMLMTGSKKPETLGFYRAAGFTDDKTAFQIRRVDYVRK